MAIYSDNLKQIDQALKDGTPPVLFLSHPRPKALYQDLIRIRSLHYPHWKGGAVKFFKHETGVQVRVAVPIGEVYIPTAEISITPGELPYLKIAGKLHDDKPATLRVQCSHLTDEEKAKLQILAAHLKYETTTDGSTITFKRAMK